MLDMAQHHPIVWSVLWQTSVLLAVALIGSYGWRRRPARAHLAITLGIVACILAPILSFAVRQLDMGVLSPAPFEALRDQESSAIAPITPIAVNEDAEPVLAATPQPTEGVEATAASARAVEPKFAPAPFPFAAVFFLCWAVVSGLLLIRFLYSLVLGVRLLARSTPLANARLNALAAEIAADMGLNVVPLVYASDDVRTPMIWSWRLHPAILVPVERGEYGEEQWAGVLRHELAHAKRLDHITGIVAELLACLVPWQPLAWWAKTRLRNLSEFACDDQALANDVGQASAYAESLLASTPQRTTPALPAAVMSKKNLERRIRRILRPVALGPESGRALVYVAVALFSSLVTAVALLQVTQRDEGAEGSLTFTNSAGEIKSDNTPDAAEPPKDAAVSRPSEEERVLAILEERMADLAFSNDTDGIRDALQIGRSLHGLESEKLLSFLEAHWNKLPGPESKEALLFGFIDESVSIRGLGTGRTRVRPATTRTAFGGTDIPRFNWPMHPSTLDVLHFGATDEEWEVRDYAWRLIKWTTFRDFALTPDEYEGWYAKYRDKPIEEAIEDGCQWLVTAMRDANVYEWEEYAALVQRNLKRFSENSRMWSFAVDSLKDAGIMSILSDWLKDPALLADRGLTVLSAVPLLKPDDDFMENTLYPFMKTKITAEPGSDEYNSGYRARDILFQDPEFKFGILRQELIYVVTEAREQYHEGYAAQLAETGDPRAFPLLLGLIAAQEENDPDEARGISILLGRLAQLAHNESPRDAAWWRGWWETNKVRYTKEVQETAIPEWEPFPPVERDEEGRRIRRPR